jgi:hypothetical protein
MDEFRQNSDYLGRIPEPWLEEAWKGHAAMCTEKPEGGHDTMRGVVQRRDCTAVRVEVREGSHCRALTLICDRKRRLMLSGAKGRTQGKKGSFIPLLSP